MIYYGLNIAEYVSGEKATHRCKLLLPMGNLEKMNLLCRLSALEVLRFLFLQASPEGLEGHHHQGHQWGQGCPVLKNDKVNRLVVIYVPFTL